MRAGWFLVAGIAACAVPDAVFDNPLDPLNSAGSGGADSSICATNNGGCAANAVCIAEAGGRTCRCPSGYTGDGVTCAAHPSDPLTGTLVTKLLRGVAFDFSYIPAGEFTMGAEKNDFEAAENERPAHLVTLSRPFLLLRTEVTQDYYEFVTGQFPSRFSGPFNPVESVSWDDAVAFCDKLSELEGVGRGTYALPTEAQWEYAARAGTTQSRYAALSEAAWFDGNGGGRTQQVRGKLPNAWNLHDMLGNVWEWTADWYGPYGQVAATDPTGPVAGTLRVYRGGSYDGYDYYARASKRAANAPVNGAFNVGFRPARSLP